MHLRRQTETPVLVKQGVRLLLSIRPVDFKVLSGLGLEKAEVGGIEPPTSTLTVLRSTY